MAKSKTIIAEVQPKVLKTKTITNSEPVVSTTANNVLEANKVVESTSVNVEPVKGKRGRKSKKELMAALGVASEMLVVNVNENKNANLTANVTSNNNNMILSVTELTDLQEHVDQVSNVVIISNPNLETIITHETQVDTEDEETIHKQVLKKRGRKPKGGKIIQQVIPVDNQINDKPNVILHLKCSMKDLQNSINSNIVDSYTFNAKNNLCYDVIGGRKYNFCK